MTANDATSYKKLHRFLRAGLSYKRDGLLPELDSESIIRHLLAKMCQKVQERWLEKVVCAKENGKDRLGFQELVKFIEHQAALASQPSFSKSAYENDPSIKSFLISVDPVPTQPQKLPCPLTTTYKSDKKVNFPECAFCSQYHELENCLEFQE